MENNNNQENIDIEEYNKEFEKKFFIDINKEDISKFINKLNKKIKSSCKHCYLSLKQEENQDIRDITHYGAIINTTNNPVLCFYYKDKCISSLLVSRRDERLSYSAKTSQSLTKKNIHTLLVSALILIAKLIDSSIEEIMIEIANPISAYVLMKNFNGELFAVYSKEDIKECITDEDFKYDNSSENEDNDEVLFQALPSLKTITYSSVSDAINNFEGCEHISGSIQCIIDIDSSVIEKANILFNKIVENLNMGDGDTTRKIRSRSRSKSRSRSRSRSRSK